VAVCGGGGHLKLWEREERVRRLEIKEGGYRGGGFDSGGVDGEFRHRCRQEALGSGGASCAAWSEEKRSVRGEAGDDGTHPFLKRRGGMEQGVWYEWRHMGGPKEGGGLVRQVAQRREGLGASSVKVA
jgi:hypothetical protein